jgi:hypothetical protein
MTGVRELIETSDQMKTLSAACSGSVLWRCVLHALENERCLDIHYRRQNPLFDVPLIPNYKVMKQRVLFERFGIMYWPILVLARLFIPVLGLAQLGVAAGISIICRARVDSTKFHLIASAPNNIRLIEAALSGKRESHAYDSDLLRLTRLAADIRITGVLRCTSAYCHLLAHIIGNRGRRRDMLLHMRDAIPLLMLTYYVRMNPDHVFVTDDHYQRWAYLLSHNSQNLQIVQHGFIDRDIEFEHKFGVIHRLFVRDQSFVRYFTQYYKVLEWKCFSGLTMLDSNPYAANAVFLASSFPSIDVEIEFVRALRQQSDTPVIIKFHPSHHYDERKQALSSFADYVCSKDQNPACMVFVSHSSFMEYDYSALGIHTVSIALSGGVKAAVEAVLRQLDGLAQQ